MKLNIIIISFDFLFGFCLFYLSINVPVAANPVDLSIGIPPANNSAKPLGVRAAIELISPTFTVPLDLTGVFDESIYC